MKPNHLILGATAAIGAAAIAYGLYVNNVDPDAGKYQQGEPATAASGDVSPRHFRVYIGSFLDAESIFDDKRQIDYSGPNNDHVHIEVHGKCARVKTQVLTLGIPPGFVVRCTDDGREAWVLK